MLGARIDLPAATVGLGLTRNVARPWGYWIPCYWGPGLRGTSVIHHTMKGPRSRAFAPGTSLHTIARFAYLGR